MQSAFLLALLLASSPASVVEGEQAQIGSNPGDFVRERLTYCVPAYPNDLPGPNVSADVSVIAIVDTRGRVSVVRREAVTPYPPQQLLAADVAARLFARVEECVESWTYAPGPVVTKYRIVLNLSPPDAPRESHPLRLVYVEPFVPQQLLTNERRVLVRGRLRADGTLENLASEGAESLEALVLAAARQWRFGGTLRPPVFATLVAVHVDKE